MYKMVIRPNLEEIAPEAWAAAEWQLRNFAASAMPASMSRQINANFRARHDVQRIEVESVPLELAQTEVKALFVKTAEVVKEWADELTEAFAATSEVVDAGLTSVDVCLRVDRELRAILSKAEQLKRANGLR